MTEKDPNGIDAHTPGAKLDAGKPRVWLCISGFANALAAVADVTTKGAAKYTPNGWMEVPNGEQRYMDAALRHLLASANEPLDPETKLPHIAHACWNLLAVAELRSKA